MQNPFEVYVAANMRALQANAEAGLAGTLLTCSVMSAVADTILDIFFPKRRIETTVTSSHYGSHLVIAPKVASWVPRG